jgi:hypothetical protein
MDRRLESTQLVHHVGVHLEPAGGVHDHHPVTGASRLLDARAGDGHDVRRAPIGIDRHVERLSQRLELIDGRRPVDVGRHQTR